MGDRPLLLAVDADLRLLGRIEGELQRAFGADFRVRGELLPEDAVRTLQGARHRQERVALVLVDDSLPTTLEPRFLRRQGVPPQRPPCAPRTLGRLGPSRVGTEDLREHGCWRHSYYVLKPWITPDELFHRVVAEFVQGVVTQ